MQTITAPTLLAALALAVAFQATGYTTKQVRPNGFVLTSGTATLAIKVSAVGAART